MKRIAIILALVIAAFAFTSCEYEEEYYYMPDSHWILHADGMVEGRRLALTFVGDELEVADGSHKTPPFTESRTWDYYLTEGGTLHISYSYSDSDGTTSSDYHVLDYSISEDGLTLTLMYETWTGRVKTYTFDRR